MISKIDGIILVFLCLSIFNNFAYASSSQTEDTLRASMSFGQAEASETEKYRADILKKTEIRIPVEKTLLL